MIALGKITFSTRKVTVDVEADSELMRGTTVADIRGIWSRKANALLVDDVDVNAAHAELLRAAILLNRFASEETYDADNSTAFCYRGDCPPVSKINTEGCSRS